MAAPTVRFRGRNYRLVSARLRTAGPSVYGTRVRFNGVFEAEHFARGVVHGLTTLAPLRTVLAACLGDPAVAALHDDAVGPALARCLARGLLDAYVAGWQFAIVSHTIEQEVEDEDKPAEVRDDKLFVADIDARVDRQEVEAAVQGVAVLVDFAALVSADEELREFDAGVSGVPEETDFEAGVSAVPEETDFGASVSAEPEPIEFHAGIDAEDEPGGFEAGVTGEVVGEGGEELAAASEGGGGEATSEDAAPGEMSEDAAPATGGDFTPGISFDPPDDDEAAA